MNEKIDRRRREHNPMPAEQRKARARQGYDAAAVSTVIKRMATLTEDQKDRLRQALADA